MADKSEFQMNWQTIRHIVLETIMFVQLVHKHTEFKR